MKQFFKHQLLESPLRRVGDTNNWILKFQEWFVLLKCHLSTESEFTLVCCEGPRVGSGAEKLHKFPALRPDSVCSNIPTLGTAGRTAWIVGGGAVGGGGTRN